MLDFIEKLADVRGLKAKKVFRPLQSGDVEAPYANTSNLENRIQFKPNTSLKYGVKQFIDWYRDIYKV